MATEYKRPIPSKNTDFKEEMRSAIQDAPLDKKTRDFEIFWQSETFQRLSNVNKRAALIAGLKLLNRNQQEESLSRLIKSNTFKSITLKERGEVFLAGLKLLPKDKRTKFYDRHIRKILSNIPDSCIEKSQYQSQLIQRLALRTLPYLQSQRRKKKIVETADSLFTKNHFVHGPQKALSPILGAIAMHAWELQETVLIDHQDPDRFFIFVSPGCDEIDNISLEFNNGATTFFRCNNVQGNWKYAGQHIDILSQQPIEKIKVSNDNLIRLISTELEKAFQKNLGNLSPAAREQINTFTRALT